MSGTDREEQLIRLLDAWDPETSDLPDELALAMDDSERLRARFDARFARWTPEAPSEPEPDAERLLARLAPRSRRTVWLSAASVSLALAASALLVVWSTESRSPVEIVDHSVSMGPVTTPPSTGQIRDPSPDPHQARRLEMLGYLSEEDEDKGEIAGKNADEMLSALGYVEPSLPAGSADRSSGDGFDDPGLHRWQQTAARPLSTFSVDVDRGSWAFARRRLVEGFLPDPASVRTEEFVNALTYDYPQPDDGPFTVLFEASPSPWNTRRHLVRIGVQGRAPEARQPVHLTFLVDTSGSMQGPDRLGLVRSALSLLVEQLGDGDTVAVATYAGSAGVALPPTPATDRARILAAIGRLEAGGSTAMGQGIALAYALADESFRAGDSNRVVIASDGDANVGVTDTGALTEMIRGHAERGIALTTLGFGQGNYQDARMEQLADDGDGNYYYIDGIEEARRVFVDDLTATLDIIARDVKIQVEWNPAVVSRYRQVGYENRALADRDFRDDRVDAGEVGAGHAVTALYMVDLLPGQQGPLATVRVRSKPPGADADSTERAFSMPRAAVAPSFAAASADHRMAVSAAAFAERLRNSPLTDGILFGDIAELARAAARPDHPHDAELLRLIERARALSGE